MTRRVSCSREAEILEAFRINAADPTVRQHRSECPVCREALDVAAWIKAVAALPLESIPLRDPSFLWWKAELARRFDAQRRAAEPVEVAGRIQAGVSIAVVLGLFLYARTELWSGHYWILGVDLVGTSALVGTAALVFAATTVVWKIFVRT